MILTQGYRIAPGSCFTCHSSDQSRPTIDTGADQQDARLRTRVYICGQCVVAMAKMVAPTLAMELILTADRAALSAMVAVQSDQVLALRERAEAAEAVLRTLASFVHEAEVPV